MTYKLIQNRMLKEWNRQHFQKFGLALSCNKCKDDMAPMEENHILLGFRGTWQQGDLLGNENTLIYKAWCGDQFVSNEEACERKLV